MQDAAVGATAGCPSLLNCFFQIDVQRFPELRNNVIAIVRMHRRISVAMENNGRDDARAAASTRSAVAGEARGEPVLAHCRERGSNISGRPAGQTGMHADCGKEVGVRCRQDGRGRGARRKPGGIDPIRIDRVVAHNLAGDARDQRGLALASLLVARAEPVPALEALAEAAWAG